MTGKAQETATAARSATEEATNGSAASDPVLKDAASPAEDAAKSGGASPEKPKFNLPMPSRIKAPEKPEAEKGRGAAAASPPAAQQAQRAVPAPKSPPANDDNLR